MNVLVTGASGYIGKLIVSSFNECWNITGVSRRNNSDTNSISCDLSDKNSVAQLAKTIKPDVIIHAAGNKKLSECESNAKQAYLDNTQTTINLTSCFPDTRIIYLSTDYVFSGQEGLYSEVATYSPVTAYGKSKMCSEIHGLMTEEQFYVLRLSALYDQNAAFVKFVSESLEQGEKIDCFDDVFYTPTYYDDFLKVVQHLVENQVLEHRIYHACGARISRYEFALLIAQAYKQDEQLIQKVSNYKKDNPFLFPDLSLENSLTLKSLHLTKASHRQNLNGMML